MMQYFSQGMDMKDFSNDISKEIEEEDESDDDDDSTDDSSDEESLKDANENDADSDIEDEITEGLSLGDKVKEKWEHRRKKLIHDLSIAGWMLSPSPEVRMDIMEHNGEHRNAVERLLKRWLLTGVRFLLFVHFFTFFYSHHFPF